MSNIKDKRTEHRSLTDGAVGPICDHVRGTDSKIPEVEVSKLLFPGLKAIVGNKCDGSIVPATHKQTGTVSGVADFSRCKVCIPHA